VPLCLAHAHHLHAPPRRPRIRRDERSQVLVEDVAFLFGKALKRWNALLWVDRVELVPAPFGPESTSAPLKLCPSTTVCAALQQGVPAFSRTLRQEADIFDEDLQALVSDGATAAGRSTGSWCAEPGKRHRRASAREARAHRGRQERKGRRRRRRPG